MAGHSHWAQIKHKKAVVDVKKSQIISKLLRAITIAAREGTDPEFNFKLRSAIEKAKEFQIPLENIERAIKKGEEKESNLEEVIYEAYLEEIQLLIKAITDNKNRTLGEVRHILNKFNGRLATPGSVIWNFQEKGIIAVSKDEAEKILEFADFYEDIEEKDGEILLITSPLKLNDLRKKIESANIKINDSRIELVPINTIEIDENLQIKIQDLINELLNLDDIEEVFTNLKS